MATIDVRGLSCPAPLIRTKQALKQAAPGSSLQIVGNGEIPLGNLKNYLGELGIDFKEMQIDNSEWILSFLVPEHAASASETVRAENFCSTFPEQSPAAENLPKANGPQAGPYAVVVKSTCMGQNEKALGELLMKSYLNVLPELDVLPQTLCFYNEGVKMACAGSPVLDALRLLESKGVRLVVCGTCIEYFGLKDSLAVGQISNMYHIATILSQTPRTIYP